MAELDQSNMGKWDPWYSELEKPEPYGDSTTYELGAAFLRDCEVVEDWGCGRGWLRNYIAPERYRGLDGSYSRFADRIVDLCGYRSSVDGVFIRHVLEHNYNWRPILSNAIAAAQRRLVLIIFTPFGESEKELAYCEAVGVPDLSLRRSDVIESFGNRTWSTTRLKTATHYEYETVFFVSAHGVTHHAPGALWKRQVRKARLSRNP